MSVVNIGWYLSALFLLALLPMSAISVAPGAELMFGIFRGAFAALAVAFALVALTLWRFRICEPMWLRRAFQWVALLATLFVALVALG